MKRERARRSRRWTGEIDRLEQRWVPSAAAAGLIRAAATATTEFMNQAGKVSRGHPAGFGFHVFAASNITIDVSSLPHADKVKLYGSNPLSPLAVQAGGASFALTLQPGSYEVQVQGQKKARFQITAYSTFVNAPTTPSPGSSSGSSSSGSGGGGTSTGTGGGSSGGSAAPALLGTYEGVATTTIVQINSLTGLPMTSNTYQYPEVMVLGHPLPEGDGPVENNPFNLLMSPTGATSTAKSGEIDLASAEVTATDAGPLLLRFWALQVTANGFSGTLVADESEQLFDANIVYGLADTFTASPQYGTSIYPYSFQDSADGAQLQTTVSATFTNSNTLDVQIRGDAISLTSEAMVTVSFVASRTT